MTTGAVVPRSSTMRTNFRASPLDNTGPGSYVRGRVDRIIALKALGNPHNMVTGLMLC